MRIIFLVFLLVVGQPLWAADEGINRVLQSGKLKVAVTASQPPYSMWDKNQQLIGFDVELAKGLASAMGVQAEFVVLPFAKLLPALNKQKVDIVLAGMNITLKRAQTVLFVGPYMMSGKSILMRLDNPVARLQQIEQFNQQSLKVAALKNSTSARFSKKVLPDVNLTEVANYHKGIAAVKSGEVDMMVADRNICLLAVIQDDDQALTALSQPLTVEPVGIAISAKNPHLKQLVQNFFDSYQMLGMIDPLQKKWFESRQWLNRIKQ